MKGRTSESADAQDAHDTVAEMLGEIARPLAGHARDDDELLDAIGDARFVLIGEASHGTHEFYHERANITKRLVLERGFDAVAVEADWPDAYRVNRYVRGMSDDADADAALSGFERFPTWMWRNRVVLDFVRWLRAHNDERPENAKAGFYGLDLYSLHASIQAVLAYLGRVDPEAAARARYRYSCFEEQQRQAKLPARGSRKSGKPTARRRSSRGREAR